MSSFRLPVADDTFGSWVYTAFRPLLLACGFNGESTFATSIFRFLRIKFV